MKSFFKMLENVFAAAAFAESGDWETARRISSEPTGTKPAARINTTRPRPRMHA